MGSIVLLDEHTINKIAAGEVVDRPSAIVKELVENSIDAKATAITVEIKNGGIGYIKIIDNGIGFQRDDVEMAFERHATSKIRREEDLLKIVSMGFRGEALASIAAISKVSLLTKNKDETIGTKVEVEAGKILLIEQAASTTGTKIEVRDIFYNVPARFKFLKKDSTEAGYIEDVIIRIALANPNIKIKYVNNGKNIIQTSGNGELYSTIFDIFGKEIYQKLLEIKYEFKDIKITGVIGLPEISRSTRMHQFTFLNKRYIKDKILNAAIDKAASQEYAINKFPFLVVNLELNPSHIDVNVHPAKLEVKFENENVIFEAVYYSIKLAIEQNNKKISPFTNIRNEEQIVKTVDEISKDLQNLDIIKIKEEKKHVFELEEPKSIKYNQEDIKPKLYNSAEEIEKSNIQKYEIEKIEENKCEISKKDEILYKYIGQIFDTYIIIEIKERMYIIDQHAAHERLLFEKFKKDYYATDRSVQMLLIPILVELIPKEKEIVINNLDMFEKSGFVIEEFGDNAIKISGVPNIGYQIDYKSMFKDSIDELLGASKTEKSEKEFKFIATLACKAAVKGNMRLNKEEQIELINNMVKLKNPFTCPHGRPTAYEISKYEIEKRFLRK